MRTAIIDIGTNTFNLLVCERKDGLGILHAEELPVFLGKGGIESGHDHGRGDGTWHGRVAGVLHNGA